MGKRFDLLVFDWDGTLFDSIGAIGESVRAVCRALSIPEPEGEQARRGIGLGLAEALRHAIPWLPEDRLPEFIERFGVEYRRRESSLGLYAGARELIERLYRAGFALGVATGKSRRGLDRVFSSTGLGRFFRASRCADECFSKPHPQMLLELLGEFSVSPERALMIGDTTHDLQMAANATISALAVSYGAHSEEHLKELAPLACFSSVSALERWLEANA